MNAPRPVVFAPLLQPKPWGGSRLATLLGKTLPPEPIGESWELVSLPHAESRVARGPLVGCTLTDLTARWRTRLLGHAPLADGRFPLLIKFLDATANLSIQVHPRPAPDDPRGWQPGVKHEAWYVIHAEPDARVYIGLRPGVTPDQVAAAVGTAELVGLLRAWPARSGDCFYIPSGTLHALGAGLVVAEPQTPSDVTFRAYDWDRVDAHGRRRELHPADTLAHVRYDVTPEMIVPARTTARGSTGLGELLAACPRFRMVSLRQPAGATPTDLGGEPAIWMVLSGAGRVVAAGGDCAFQRGDVVLLPAEGVRAAEFHADTHWLEVTIQGESCAV